LLTEDVIKYFSPLPDDARGAKKAITDALDLSSGYVSQWGDTVPEAQAMKLYFMTGGKERNGVVLVYDPAVYKKRFAAQNQ
jgi:hypothetical protein